MIESANLAINGGPKVRKQPLPYRRLFGERELAAVREVFEDSWHNEVDFGYQGKFEKMYTDSFCDMQGGGFADAVCSGTVAIYLALSALDVEAGSDVIVSPVTDPGSVTPIIISRMNPVIADSQPNSFNIGPKEFEKALTPNTRAAILTHAGGFPIDIEPIIQIAKRREIKIIEDCSQAHGALYNGKRVGRFGDIAAFSTMFSKNHATGGCGGIVYMKNEKYYWRVRSLADRGKTFEQTDYDAKKPGQFLFPALNFNLDELSCAIGFSTLSRLQETITRRCAIVKRINQGLERSCVVSGVDGPGYAMPSPFFHTVTVDVTRLKVSKTEFAQAVMAEGIWVNPDYKYVVSEWGWIRKFMKKNAHTPNATAFRKTSFNIMLNERFSERDADDIVSSILKVEAVLARR